MAMRYPILMRWALFALVIAWGPAWTAPARAQTLQVCTSVPDLADLVRQVGGQRVSVTAFAKGTEDPHFLEAKPSFVKSLNRANLLVMVGLSLEAGWSPVVLQNARNGAVLPGSPGYLEAAAAIRPLDVPTGPIDRSMGDVHPGGNPHFLLDPICGLQVARLICDRLSQLEPGQKAYFEERYEAFGRRLGEDLVGPQLARKYKIDDYPKLALLFEYQKLEPYLKSQQEDRLLGGWLGQMLPYHGTKVVDDHTLWPYFARRFGLQIVAHLEPKPGIPPTTQHLASVVQIMRAQRVRLIFASPYFDLRHAQFVASNTGAAVVPMAHQVGSRAGADDYLAMVDYNVRQVVKAIEGAL